MGAQLDGDGQTLGSLLVAEARRGKLALTGRGTQGGKGCGGGHVALERAVAKLARAAALKILFTANSSQTVYNTKGTARPPPDIISYIVSSPPWFQGEPAYRVQLVRPGCSIA